MDCKNNYSSTVEFNQSFGKEKDIKVCSTCTYFESVAGIYICKLFNNEDGENRYENQ